MPGLSQRGWPSPRFVVAEMLAVGDEEVEAVVVGRMGRDLRQVRRRAGVAGQEIGDQGTARAGMAGGLPPSR
jgi:hypothetical protein